MSRKKLPLTVFPRGSTWKFPGIGSQWIFRGYASLVRMVMAPTEKTMLVTRVRELFLLPLQEGSTLFPFPFRRKAPRLSPSPSGGKLHAFPLPLQGEGRDGGGFLAVRAPQTHPLPSPPLEGEGDKR